MGNYETPEATYYSAEALSSVYYSMSGGGSWGGGSSGGTSGGTTDPMPKKVYSYKYVTNEKYEQSVSNGEMKMISVAGINFINSQTLEEDNMWVYKFRFLGIGISTNRFDDPLDEVWMAEMHLEATKNVENQHYNISDGNSRIGCTAGESKDLGKFVDLASEAAGIFIDIIAVSWPPIAVIWTGVMLAAALVESLSEKENDFDNNHFHRNWDFTPTPYAVQFWDVKIVVPPGENVEFKFSYDMWTTEKLSGSSITCKINAPANLTSTNNYKGVTYSVE